MFLSATNGDHIADIFIDGVTTQDWEDIACGPCSSSGNDINDVVKKDNSIHEFCVYIADTGGNAGGVENAIYRVRELDIDFSNMVGGIVNVSVDSSLLFRYNCK